MFCKNFSQHLNGNFDGKFQVTMHYLMFHTALSINICQNKWQHSDVHDPYKVTAWSCNLVGTLVGKLNTVFNISKSHRKRCGRCVMVVYSQLSFLFEIDIVTSLYVVGNFRSVPSTYI